ncbi:MAG TPA: hypothetical protein VN241_11725, partial [Microbacterium sp.]|nr:hypothetical protein [Microbacterium sp.]
MPRRAAAFADGGLQLAEPTGEVDQATVVGREGPAEQLLQRAPWYAQAVGGRIGDLVHACVSGEAETTGE